MSDLCSTFKLHFEQRVLSMLLKGEDGYCYSLYVTRRGRSDAHCKPPKAHYGAGECDPVPLHSTRENTRGSGFKTVL